jgi:MFS transporter, ACS family, D-galactonate transporter
VGLVFLFMLVNYADKAVIGLSSVPIMRELGLTNSQFGTLGSAFFMLFSLSGVLVGFAANRIRPKVLMLGMALVWTLALLPMIWASSFALLLASRVILGAAEGPSFPVALHAVYKWFADSQRALPTSIVACGAAVGTGLIAPTMTWVIVRHGWHAAFGTLGVAGLVWAAAWLIYAEDGAVDRATSPIDARRPVQYRIPYRRLLLSRTAVGVFIAGFGAYWVIALNIVWLANYLMKGLQLQPTDAAWIVALPSLLQILLAPVLAGLSQEFTRRGLSSRVSRGVLGSLCVITSGASMICMAHLEMGSLKVFLIGLAFSIGSVIFTLGSTLIGEISPPSQRGAMLGITNSVHTLAGLCAPFIMGLMVDVGANPATGFRTGFIDAGLLVVAAGIVAALLIDPQADLREFHNIE